MFYMIGFYVLLGLLVLWAFMWFKTSPLKVNGAMSWIDIYSKKPMDTVKFLENVFKIKQVSTKKNALDTGYHIIKSKGQFFPFAGVMDVPTGACPGAMIYLTVKNMTDAHTKMLSFGAELLKDPIVINGLMFTVYKIPGDVVIGLCQYENL